MKNKEQVLGRVEALAKQGAELANGQSILDMVGSEGHLAAQTWLGQAVLVINAALPSPHPFRKQAAAYLYGGGLLGVQGMLSLLNSLALEIKAGTFD